MSKKHFIELARIFLKFDKTNGVIIALLYDVCELCKVENPNFDKAQFLKACGVNS